MKKIYLYLKDNFCRPSTYFGIIIFFISFKIFTDKNMFDKLIENIINNNSFIELIVGAISGALFAHRQKDTDKKDN